MGQNSYTAGQSPLLVSDIITRYETEVSIPPSTSVDYFTPLKIVLAEVTAVQPGSYYTKPSQTSAPVALPSAQEQLTTGNIYEATYPSDCVDNGVTDITLTWGASPPYGVVPASDTVNTDDESTWDFASTTVASWRQAGRVIRCYVPNAYSSSTPKITIGYKRFATYPSSSSDAIDIPAEYAESFYQKWKARLWK